MIGAVTGRNAQFCVAFVTVALGGGAVASAASTRSASTAVSTASATALPSSLAGRLLTDNEIPGFTAARPTVYRTESAWEKAGWPTVPGFVVGAKENLTHAGGRAGVSAVAKFRSASAARAGLAAELRTFKSNDVGYYSPFRVTGIPGALGLAETGEPGGINVAFTSGHYLYLVGEQVSSVTSAGEHSVELAAQHLYHRSSG